MRKTGDDKPKKERCVCGGVPVEVKTRAGKMLSCPNPARCSENLRTAWHKTEDAAVVDWNNIVSAVKFRNARRKAAGES